jgi:DNA-binding transcriptional ArsR family regulator
MVHYQPAPLDAVFGALADPTRRAVLALLTRGGQTVGELAEPFGMSLTGFLKHVHILERAGLIERQKSGRIVSCRLHAGALREAHAWLERHEIFWNARLDRLGAFLAYKEQAQCNPPSTKTRGSSSGGPTTPPSTRSGPRGPSRRR